jgi:F0F1-type ATP synthase delta subunit
MIQVRTVRNAARKIAHHLFSLPDPQHGLADVLSRVRQLPVFEGIDFLKLLHRELTRLQPYTQNRVETPDGLDDGELAKISDNFSSHLGQSAVLRNVQNPALIGGVRVTIGDRRWERSIRSCLKAFTK